MIGKLSGVIDEIYQDRIILDVSGVGYLIYIPQNTLLTLQKGENACFYIHTYVREDALRLYGFSNKEQIEWFLMLQEVPKVGAKVAFTILGVVTVSQLKKAIAFEEDASISKAPCVGKKVATRIIAELKNKSLDVCDVEYIGSNAHLDAVSALVNLSYSKEQASLAVSSTIKEYGKDLDCASLVRYSLKKLANNN